MQTITKADHKYLQIADNLEYMIHDETLRIGDKLPSVRTLSTEYGISMGTAFQAYYHLEGKGLIEARPKSGYYVRFNNKRFPAGPTKPKTEPVVNEVSTQEMIAAVYRNITETDLLNFSIGAPQVELLPAAKLNKSVMHALRSSKYHCLQYEDPQGNPELRKQIAKLCFSWGGKINPEEIIVTAGCVEALTMCLKAVTQPGDTIAVERPAYFGIFQILENLGLKAIEIPTCPEDGIDVDFLKKAIKKFGIKACMFVPNFSNPMGYCMPDEKKKELVDLITRLKIPLIEDDIYGEIYFTKKRPMTCKTFDKEGWVLHCSSVSKSLAPGYRVGWCIPGRFAEKVKVIKTMHTLSGTTLTQVAIAHFLSIGRYDHHLKKLRMAMHTQCLRYIQAIIQYFPSTVRLSRPEGGFVLWLEMPTEVNAYKLYQQAIKHRISVTPGQIFSSGNDFRNCIRISYGKAWDDTVDRGLKLLGGLVKKQMGGG